MAQQMLRFDEVLASLQGTPGGAFIGLSFSLDNRFLRVYEVSNEPDDQETVSVAYEGGRLFSASGEEEHYVLDELPADLKAELDTLVFRLSDALPEWRGLQSDFVLWQFCRDLPDPDHVCGSADQAHFARQAAAYVKRAWTLETSPGSGESS